VWERGCGASLLLLVERFHLKFHYEKKELPIYALTVDTGGAKMTPHPAGNAGEAWIDQSQVQSLHMKLVARFADGVSCVATGPVSGPAGGGYDRPERR
jgi:uncharacterized protein (TIGR03435 family)